MLEDVVQIRQKILAPSHPRRLASEVLLARAYIENKQPEKGIEMLKGVMEALRGILAPTHQTRVWAEKKLARAHASLKQSEKATEILEAQGIQKGGRINVTAHPKRVVAENEFPGAYSSIERPGRERASKRRKMGRAERRHDEDA